MVDDDSDRGTDSDGEENEPDMWDPELFHTATEGINMDSPMLRDLLSVTPVEAPTVSQGSKGKKGSAGKVSTKRVLTAADWKM